MDAWDGTKTFMGRLFAGRHLGRGARRLLAGTALLAALQPLAASAQTDATAAATVGPAQQAAPLLQFATGIDLDRPPDRSDPLLKLGPGDAVAVQVFGRPEFNTTAYVAEDLTIAVPLAGAVAVGGLSPADAAQQVATALREGQFLVDPQVSITLVNFRSQQISVLGEVRQPGRFPIESKTTVLDVLALAGGIAETGSDVVYLIRQDENGQLARYSIDLKTLTGGDPSSATFPLQGGDSLVVPRAEQFYVYGEVNTPNMYRLEPNTTVVQAITRSGGLTPRGSDSRIEIRRKGADGKYRSFKAELTDVVQANDVIRVKERIF